MSHLLIVDDEPDFLDELAEALSFEGLTSTCVSRAGEAIAAVRADPNIDIVVTDIRMPDMDGVDLIQALKASFPERTMKFVVMTGHAAEEDIRRAQAAGADAWFPKPLAFASFCQTLATMGGMNRQT
ncbi:response regulator [Xanthobacter agilis]|uniref:CheY-like chemotaxis protein n=1 Tax=Xanthobacter agilis TaxID=47492 RepID=A0ABU0LK05_XANAG|nr:response regulator [Xanthobacter agilis]MDQ0507466.1 CheY-like chemotaxis protein [Xanthobacter agilis]